MENDLLEANYTDTIKKCKNCKHFRLHYIKYSRGNYSPLSYGHCVKPRLKKRDADTIACEYWVEKQLDTQK